jgi:hypothetical protein
MILLKYTRKSENGRRKNSVRKRNLPKLQGIGNSQARNGRTLREAGGRIKRKVTFKRHYTS